MGKQKLVIKFFPQVQAGVFCVGVWPSCDSLHFTQGVFPRELGWGHRTGLVAECRMGLHWDFWFGSSPGDVPDLGGGYRHQGVVSKGCQSALETLRILLFKPYNPTGPTV